MPAELVSIAVLFPELLGTYGDGGNAAVLAQRLEWRGLGAEVVAVGGGTSAGVPDSCDVYLLGGGEDGPQALAVRELESTGALRRAVDRGAAVLAVCAGYQILGDDFAGQDGEMQPGLGLLECSTRRGEGRRRVGEIVVDPDSTLALPRLTGYENHQGVTTLGEGARPLGTVVAGSGNDGGGGDEGIIAGRVVGTYLHGPVLARNPALADLLLSWVVGPLDPLDDTEVDALRAERMRAAARNPLRSWRPWGR